MCTKILNKLLLTCMFSAPLHTESPDRWKLFWKNHPGFSHVAGAEDYGLQVTTNQYALDDLSQELSRGVMENRRAKILQEIANRKTAVSVLEEQIETMMPPEAKRRRIK